MQRNERALRAARSLPLEVIGAEWLNATGFEDEAPEPEFDVADQPAEPPQEGEV